MRAGETISNNKTGEKLTMLVSEDENRGTPAGGVVRAFQLAYGVANDDGAAPDGLPKNPLVRLVFIGMSGGFLPGIPLFAQRAVFSFAAFIAKVTGVNTKLAKYFNDEDPQWSTSN